MRDLGALDGDVEELDGRGLCALPGLVDCHTHACFAGDRAREFELRARGASYEELHAAGGGILSTVEATRAAGEDGLRAAVRRHREWMLHAGTTTFEAKSGYGLDRETELASLRAIAAEGGIPTWLGAHAVPPEFDDADAYLDFALAEVLPEAARIAEAADVFLERGAFTVGAGAALPRGVPRRGPRASPARRPVLGAGGDPARGRARRAVGRPPRGDGRARASARSRRATSSACCSRWPRSSWAGPMPPGAGARRRGRGGRARHRLQSRAARSARAFRWSCSLACTQLRLSPAEALGAVTVNAAHVLRRADRIGRLEPGYDADVVLLDAPDWRHLAYHVGGEVVGAVVQSGRLAGGARLSRVPTRKQRRRRAKERRHEYEYVYVDEEGREVEVEPEEEKAPARKDKRTAPVSRPGAPSSPRPGNASAGARSSSRR